MKYFRDRDSKRKSCLVEADYMRKGEEGKEKGGRREKEGKGREGREMGIQQASRPEALQMHDCLQKSYKYYKNTPVLKSVTWPNR